MVIMKLRILNIKDKDNISSLWNEVIKEEECIYRQMTQKEVDAKFLTSTDYYKVISIGAYLNDSLIGFSSGVFIYEKAKAYITTVVVKKEYRRQGFGGELLREVESEILHQSNQKVKTIDLIFYNPVNLEWVIPGTDNHQHPGAPGVDNKSLSHIFYLANGYKDYVYQYAYYQSIDNYEFSEKTFLSQEMLKEQNISIEYYDSNKHTGFNELFTNLKNPGWKQAIDNNLSKEEPYPILIVQRDNQILGFTGPVYKQDNDRGYFAGIGVHSSLRGMGVGSVLFSSLCKSLKQLGATYMSFFTGENNPARKLYEREGFKVVRTFTTLRKEI